MPFHWFLNTFRWAIDLLDGISGLIVKAMGVNSAPVTASRIPPKSCKSKFSRHASGDCLPPAKKNSFSAPSNLHKSRSAKSWFRARTCTLLPWNPLLDEVMRVFATTQRSRIPVYRGTQDHILGFVHIKDMMWILLDRERRIEENLSPPPFDLRRVLREVLIVPETKPASELLHELRTRHVGMAVVVDEFGSILGLVTMEDILEQMVGEIHDEFDVVERPLTLADGAVIFDAALNVRDLDAQYNITVA